MVSLAQAARLVLLVVFGLSAVEKSVTMFRRRAAWHPVLIVSEWRRAHAFFLLGAALTCDCAIVLLLLTNPRVGGACAFGLIAAYTFLAQRVHSDTEGKGCACLWKLLNSKSRGSLLVRNVMLSVFALGVAVAGRRGGLSEPVLGIAFLLAVDVTVRIVDWIHTKRVALGGRDYDDSSRGWTLVRPLVADEQRGGTP